MFGWSNQQVNMLVSSKDAEIQRLVASADAKDAEIARLNTVLLHEVRESARIKELARNVQRTLAGLETARDIRGTLATSDVRNLLGHHL